MDTGLGSNAGLNALTFDKAGNVYVSDFVPGGGLEDRPDGWSANTFVASQTLSPQAAAGVTLIRPSAPTASSSTINLPRCSRQHCLPLDRRGAGEPEPGRVGVARRHPLGADDRDQRARRIAVDRHDNLWVVANQQDEIDVVDPNAIDAKGDPLAKIIARRGDFDGIGKNGRKEGLLFPASPAFSLDGKTPLRIEHRAVLALCGLAAGRQLICPGRSRSSTTRSPRSAPKSRRWPRR